MQNPNATYEQQKNQFLDSLQPDDLRNAASFNQMEEIIKHLNKSIDQLALNKENSDKFITKAAKNLFRENSPVIEKMIHLFQLYLKTRSDV